MWSVAAPRGAQMRRDPAPTRWSYRYQRMMLTPAIRKLLTRGVPLAALAGTLAILLSTGDRSARIAAQWQDLRHQIESRPEFAVTALAVHGADTDLQRQIRTALPYDFPQSRFDLDLDAMRAAVTALPAVQGATLMIRAGGVLELTVTPRTPVAVWRMQDGLRLIDASGTFAGGISARTDRADLPLVAGEGADAAMAEAQDLIAALGPLTPRFAGLVRVGARRWDVVLSKGQRILLPMEQPVQTLERVAALAQASDLLERDLAVIDMRVPRRPTLKLRASAAESLREARMKQTESE